MVQVVDGIDQDNLPGLKKDVERAYEYWKPNYDRYHKFRKFVFDTSLTSDDIEVLKMLQKPQIECNIQEAYISRLRGEFSKQEPSIEVSAAPGKPIDLRLIKTVEDYTRALLFEANNNSFEYDVYTDLLSGGFSVMKDWTEYEHQESFNQIIKIGRPYDVTMCGFDPLSQLHDKSDGRYCFELFPKSKDEFKDEFPEIDINRISFIRNVEGFNWAYQNNNEDILLMCQFYMKKKKRQKLLLLPHGKSMLASDYNKDLKIWEAAMQKGLVVTPPPQPIDSRMTETYKIWRYTFIPTQIIEVVETDYAYFPLIFVDGNSITIKDNSKGSSQLMTRPYIYHAQGIQKLKNYAMQNLGNELENMVQHKWKVAKESIPQEYSGAYTNNQIPNIIIYNAYENMDVNKPLPPPEEVVRPPIPQEITNTFMIADQSMQAILGSYDAQLGIQQTQLSGVAIQEGATQSNATAMPYIVGFLRGLNSLLRNAVDLYPKYMKGEQSITLRDSQGNTRTQEINTPNGIKFDYKASDLNIRVSAGVNFAIQKTKAMQQITTLMQASPLFAQFMNEDGLEILINNLECKDSDELKVKAKVFMQKMAQQKQQAANMPPPQIMELQLKQQAMQLQAQQQAQESQLKAQELAIKQQDANTDRLDVMGKLHNANKEMAVQVKKADAEEFSKAAELHLQHNDMLHDHTMRELEMRQNITNSRQNKEKE